MRSRHPELLFSFDEIKISLQISIIISGRDPFRSKYFLMRTILSRRIRGVSTCRHRLHSKVAGTSAADDVQRIVIKGRLISQNAISQEASDYPKARASSGSYIRIARDESAIERVGYRSRQQQSRSKRDSLCLIRVRD
jgi:hypothetical protein